MLNKVLVIGIVGVLIVGGFLFLFPNDDDGGDGGNDGSVTIYVQAEGSDDTASAEFDLGQPSMAEMMMLSIGQGIRSEDFMLQDYEGEPGGSDTPQVPIDGIGQAQRYNVWMTAKITITGSNLNGGLTSSAVSFRAGNINTGMLAYWNAGQQYHVVTMSSCLNLGENSVDQSQIGKWCYYQSGDSVTPLLGSHLDGLVLSIDSTANAMDLNGRVVGYSVAASIQLDVSSYAADGSLKASITDIGVDNDFLGMIDADLCMDVLDQCKVAA